MKSIDSNCLENDSIASTESFEKPGNVRENFYDRGPVSLADAFSKNGASEFNYYHESKRNDTPRSEDEIQSSV